MRRRAFRTRGTPVAVIAVGALVHCLALCMAFTCEPKLNAEGLPNHDAPCHEESDTSDSNPSPTCDETASERTLPKNVASDSYAVADTGSGFARGVVQTKASPRFDSPPRAVDATAKTIRTTVLTI